MSTPWFKIMGLRPQPVSQRLFRRDVPIAVLKSPTRFKSRVGVRQEIIVIAIKKSQSREQIFIHRFNSLPIY